MSSRAYEPTVQTDISTAKSLLVCGLENDKSTADFCWSAGLENDNSTANSGPTNQLQILGFAVDLWPGTCCRFVAARQFVAFSGPTNQQQIPGFAVDLWPRNLLLICSSSLGSHKSTVNVGLANVLDDQANVLSQGLESSPWFVRV